eukprot:6200542-Pleurochrysis_carterae.AAC.2
MADVIEHRGAVRPMARCSPQPVGQRHIGFSGRADGPQKTSLSAFSSARLVRTWKLCADAETIQTDKEYLNEYPLTERRQTLASATRCMRRADTAMSALIEAAQAWARY